MEAWRLKPSSAKALCRGDPQDVYRRDTHKLLRYGKQRTLVPVQLVVKVAEQSRAHARALPFRQGTNVRNVVHVSDVAVAVRLVLELRYALEELEIMSGQV